MKITIYKDDIGEYRWRVRARNGRIIAEGGEGYKRKDDLVKALLLLADVRWRTD